MGDAQSAQRDAKRDAEQSGAGEDAETDHSPEDKPLENKEPISEINGKAAGSLAGFNVHSEDAAEGIPSPDKDVSDVEINAKKLADEEEEVPVKMIEMEAKQNEINESFRRFFSNIGLKLTVKKGSAEKDEIQVPGEEPNKQEDIKDTAKETKSENGKQNKDLNAAQEGYDNDSTTGPTMTEGTSEDFLANAEEKTTETKTEADSNKADAASTSYASEGGHQEAATEEVVASPFKRFFKTGIFSGIRRKRKEPAEKELVDMGKKEGTETMEQTVQDQQQDKEEVEVWKELQEIKPKDEAVSAASAQTTDEAKSPSTDPSAIIVTESEILSSQEKVQASPMKRLLSGSSLKRRSKKQRGRKLSDGKLSDSGEHSSDNFMSSTESADNPREDSSPQSSTEATGEEDGPWASFKKLMTPKKRVKGSSSGPEEAQGHEAKPSEGEQASDQSAEEGRKRKDSSVSWEAVLCGSGRRRSRKTSDSEDEAPQNDNADNKQDSGTKQGTETPLESSNEVHEDLASPPKQAGSPPEGDGGSTWKSFKKLVTPKRKAKDENESRDNIHSDSEITQDDSSFSIKKLLPGRKKRKSNERQDQVSSDEAEKEAVSGDEDSETPAVVPLSEFETAETGVQIQTQADIESYAPKELEDKLQQDLPHDKAEPVVPCDNQQIEAEKVPKKEEALKSEGSTAPGTDEEADEDSISKHQQLSDITEEGAITDTMATPASTNEEAARDDTIAEDLIEITSEAITAPEPVDVTLADETEMISAVSQLSESSKTSGNTTPVPTELDDKDTELLLQNVAENISKSPEAAPACSEQPSSERIVGSDTPIELAATAQTESVSDANDAMSTDIVSEVPTEEFNTAEITVDDAYKEDVSQLQDTISELEATDDSQHLMECVSEVNEAVSAEALPKDEEVVPGSIAGADKAEISKTASQDAESAAVVADGTKDGVMEQENQILVEKEDQVPENVPEQVSVEDQPPAVADEQEALTTDTLVSEKDSVHSPKKDVPFSEDILSAEKVSDEPKEIAEHLTEVPDEPENNEPQTESPKIDQHVTEVVQEAVVDAEEGSVQPLEKEVTSEEVPPEEIVKDKAKDETVPPAEVSAEQVDASKTEPIQEPEALQGVQATTLDSEAGSPETLLPEETVRDEPQEDMVPFPEVEVKLFDSSKTKHIQEPEVLEAATLDSEAGSRDTIQPAETVRDEPKEETVPSPEVEVKLVDASKTEHIQEPEVVQAATLDSEVSSSESNVKEVISEDIPSEGTLRAEPKVEPVPLAEDNVEPVDTPKTEHIQETEASQAVQAAALEPEAGSPQAFEKEVIPKEVQPEETARDEPKVEPVPLAEDNVEPVDTPKTEHIQETEASQAVQAAALEPEADSPQVFEKEVIPKEVQPEETATDEPKEEPVPLVEGNAESLDASKDKHIQEPETLQAATLNSEADSSQLPQKEVISGDVPPVKTVSEEAQEKPVPLAEGNVESTDAFEIKHIQEPETLQAATLNSEEGSPELPQKEVTSEDVSPDDIVRDELKEETVPLAEGNDELVDGSKTEQKPEVLQAATLDSEEGSPESLEKEVTSEDAPSEGTVKDEPKEEPVLLPEDNVESVDASNTEQIQEPKVIQATTLDSEANSPESLEKEAISEDVAPEDIVKDETKAEPVPLAEVNVEPVDAPKTEHIQEPEAPQAATLDSDANSLESLEKEAISKDVAPEEIVKDETKEEPVLLAEVNVKPVDAPKTEYIQEPEASQAATLDSEVGSPESPKKQAMSEDVPPEDTVRDEAKQEPVLLAEVNVKPVDAPETEHIQEPQASHAATLDSEAGSPESPKKQAISEDVPPEDTVQDEVKQEPVPLAEVDVKPADAPETEHVQEPQALQAATLDAEASSSESLEKRVTSEDVPPEETVIDKPKEETVPLTEVNAEPVEDSKEPELLQAVRGTTSDSEAGGPQLLKKEEISEDVQVEAVTDESKQAPEICIKQEEPPVEPEALVPDVKDVTETETGVAAPSVEESSSQETQILSDDVPEPAGEDVIASVPAETEGKVVDQALETNNDQKTESLPQGVEVELEDSTTEAVHELQTSPAVTLPSVMEEASCVQILEETVLSKETPEPRLDSAEATDEPTHTVQVNGEVEEIDGLVNAEMKIAEVQHVLMMQVTTCNLNDEMPNVVVEETSETHEPLIDRMAGETELKEAVESATPLLEDSVAVEDSHRIQMQVVDVDIKSLIEVGVTENKEVTDFCNQPIDKVEVLAAISGIEEEVFNKETKVTVQEDNEHVKENLPKKIPESLVVSLEQEILKDALTEVIRNELNQAANHKESKESTEIFTERQDEGSAATSDDSAIPTEHHHMQTSDTPGHLDISEHDLKVGLKETKAEDEMCPSEEPAVEKINENTTEAQQTTQTQIVTTSNGGLVAPQNTGIISSVHNLDSPSSFSLEVKFNIQFGQAKAAESPTSPTEKLKPLKQTDVTEVDVQVVAAEGSINATERDESEKPTSEPAVNLDSTEGTKTTSQAAQLDVGIQAMETIEPVEEVTSTETVTPNVQAAETVQPATQTETREVLLSQPALYKTEAEKPTVEQTKEENEDDVWLDAEEEIYAKEKTKEPREQDEKAEREQETQQEAHKSEGTPESESEGEHFAVALENPETITASDMTMDLN